VTSSSPRKPDGNNTLSLRTGTAGYPWLSSITNCRSARAGHPVQVGRQIGAAIRDLRGAGRQPTPLPQSIQGQGDGWPRSRGTTRPIVVSCRRLRTVHTTERRPAVTSGRRSIRHAASKEIDDRRLRLPVAVEPIVRNHSSRKNDADPKHERKNTSNSGAPGRHPVQIPLRDAPINARVKDPYVQTCQQEH